jgi:hypothetical protein
MSDIDGFERIRMMLARSGKDQSYAQRKHSYRDPAKTIKFDREKTMQRDYDVVEGLLDLWAEDQRRPPNDVQGYPSEASGGFITSWRKDAEDTDDLNERIRIGKIDASFNDLSPRYQNAIKLHYGIMTRTADVWRHYIPATFDEAKIVIRVKFVKRGGLL